MQSKKTAVLAAVHVNGQSEADFRTSLDELARLVKTLGFEVVGEVVQRRASPSVSTFLGEGKLHELALFTGGPGFVQGFSGKARKSDQENDQESDQDSESDQDLEDHDDSLDEDDHDRDTKVPNAFLVVVDAEISPTQLKNLEEAAGTEVLDRTGVILEIFSRHAKSREARLQVEIAKLNYLGPRLRASKIGGDRQGGGIGAKGAGETTHELDRRRIRDRIVELKAQLDEIRDKQEHLRKKRRGDAGIALVGYTNAGKSSLMRALTGSEVLVEDKLFATLDTKTRLLQPPTVPPVLVSDTVGFIRNLPHDLVASFRSTLDEALAASLLLFTVDASDPTFRSQLEVTREVLGEIGADDRERLTIMNKIDRIDAENLAALREEFPDAVFISTRDPADIARLRERILAFFETDMVETSVHIPYEQGALVGEIRKKLRVLGESYEEDGIILTVRLHPDMQDWLSRLMSRKS